MDFHKTDKHKGTTIKEWYTKKIKEDLLLPGVQQSCPNMS